MKEVYLTSECFLELDQKSPISALKSLCIVFSGGASRSVSGADKSQQGESEQLFGLFAELQGTVLRVLC